MGTRSCAGRGADGARRTVLFAAGLTVVLSPPPSSGPQNCAACVHEGIYEEGISILESGSVSEKSSSRKRQSTGNILAFLLVTPVAAWTHPSLPWSRLARGAAAEEASCRWALLLTSGPSPQAFPDNAARREVESLPAVCPSDGCTWKGTLKEYEVGASCAGSAWSLNPTPEAVAWSPRKPTQCKSGCHLQGRGRWPTTRAWACRAWGAWPQVGQAPRWAWCPLCAVAGWQ